jgi:amino acid transporter
MELRHHHRCSGRGISARETRATRCIVCTWQLRDELLRLGYWLHILHRSSSTSLRLLRNRHDNICFTLPPLEDILAAPYGQALPYILNLVMGSKTGALILMVMILFVTLFCSVSITTAAARCTWAFSRDNALPLASIWTRTIADRPIYALSLVTIIEMLLGLINLGSSSAFTAFASVGVIALAIGYLVPISISLLTHRREVKHAKWNCGNAIGTTANIGAVMWILFELVLFSMPTALPVTEVSMNYASVVLAGFACLSLLWYAVSGRKRKLLSIGHALEYVLTMTRIHWTARRS